jgi:fimbrial chaperone protein
MTHACLRSTRRVCLAICLMAVHGWVAASGLQVSPTTLSLGAKQNADGLELSNTGDGVIHAQVRVYRWTQNEQGDQLAPSQGLVISPPMLQVAVGGQQMIRVIRTGAPPSGAGAVEEAYRLSIDELPIDSPGGAGLHFVVHYSVPIFVEPVDVATTTPSLQWKLEQDGSHAVLRVSNQGNGHAQLANIAFTNAAGTRTEIVPGLLGYVLPGATMHWMLTQPTSVFTTGGTLEIMVNGQKTTQSLSLANGPT